MYLSSFFHQGCQTFRQMHKKFKCWICSEFKGIVNLWIYHSYLFQWKTGSQMGLEATKAWLNNCRISFLCLSSKYYSKHSNMALAFLLFYSLSSFLQPCNVVCTTERSWCNDWIFQHPRQMLLIDHSCGVNGGFWQSFFPNVLKTVLCSGHNTECLVFCYGCRYWWVCRGETLLQGEHNVYEHAWLLYVCLSHRLRPYWWLLLHRWVQRSL